MNSAGDTRIHILTESGSDIGTGHVVRMKRLATHLGQTVRWLEKGSDVSGIRGVLVVDVYQADANLHRRIRSVHEGPVVYFGFREPLDDPNTWIVNLAEGQGPYPGSPRPRRMEGLAYAIPPVEGIPWRTSTLPSSPATLMAVFGGTDPTGLAAQLIHLVRRWKDGPNVTVIRAGSPDALPNPKLSIISAVENVSAILHQYDFVITSPGNLLLECLWARVPHVAVCQTQKQAHDFAGFPMVTGPGTLNEILSDIDLHYRNAVVSLNSTPVPGSSFHEVTALISELANT